MASLTEEQTQKLTQYQAITQVENLEEGLSQLIDNDWNVERAIQHFYDNHGPKETPSRPPSRFSLFSLLFWPFGLAWSLLSFITRFLPLHRSIEQKRRKPPSVLAAEFKQQFESKYGPDHIPFFQGGYSEALEKAKRDLLFLLVVLHSSDHDETDRFCRETLTSADLIQCIQDHRVLVWAGDVEFAEAHKVSCTLKATTYPFLGLIALQSNKMTVVERMEGPAHPQELVSQLSHAIERHGASLQRLQHERDERERERQLRVDQDEAYHQSLKADQEKARRQQEEQEAKAQAERERQLLLEQKALLKQKREQYIQYLYAQLPDEPTHTPSAKINFRLADGDRVVRQFESQATVDTLYRFVEVYPLLKENKPKQPVEAPLDYHHQYQFTLHTTFPRMEFPPEESTPLVDIKNIWPSATLVVDQNDDDDEE
ncbi:thioredoxin-like protein [Choanephora cucurbitarum]|nr:thioredoxin-like protein [Choanephora cucurbitarum]